MAMRENKKILQPKRAVFSFVVDGKCERWYLQSLQQHEKVNINLEPKLPQKKILSVQFAQVEELAEGSEKVFWIIDFDTILKETQEVKKDRKTPLHEFQELYNKAKKNEKIIIIVNNPCLEYWFLLHFEQTSKFFSTYEKLEKSVKKYLTDYEKTEKYYKNSRQNIYQRLKPHLPTARANAENLGEFTFDNVRTGITEMQKIFNSLGISSR
jgi:hypothetical protein